MELDDDPLDAEPAPNETVCLPAVDADAAVLSRPETPSLLILHGPQIGQRFTLDRAEITVGRGEDVDIMLVDDRVSRLHCTLHVRGRDVIVVDNDSRNGVRVDGRRVRRAKLTPFSQLHVGNTVARLECKTDAELEMESGLIHAERMAAAGILAGGVAHEFNNLISIILGNAELMLCREAVNGEVRECLEVILETAYRASEVTRRLLTFVRADAGAREPVRLDQLITTVIQLARKEVERHEVHIEAEIPPLPECRIDRVQIEQGLLNLLINAQHALEGQAEKRIAIAAGQAADTSLWVTITDTGCGIPAKDLDRVFLPFFSTKGAYAQTDSMQRSARGTGLGLSICQTIITNHGGTLSVESEVGRGTTFRITLPLRPPAGAPPAARPNPPPSPAPAEPGAHVKTTTTIKMRRLRRRRT